MIYEINYDKIFDMLWGNTYCKYKHPGMYAMLNLRTGEIECNDPFFVDGISPYLIIREFSIPCVDIRKLFVTEELFEEFKYTNRSIEEFLKFKEINDKEIFKDYFVENWKSTHWYFYDLAKSALDQFYTER